MKLTFKSKKSSKVKVSKKDLKRLFKKLPPWQVHEFLEKSIHEAESLKAEARKRWMGRYLSGKKHS